MTVNRIVGGSYLVGRRTYAQRSATYVVDDAGDGYWSTNTWIAADSSTLGALAQPGSRFYFIDPSQTVVTTELAIDQAARIYYWNGTNIVDINRSPTDEFGVTYGTDPRNPNPAANIRAFKRWVYCGPHNGGADIGAAQYVGRPTTVTYARNTGAFADGWFFKRGTIYDFSNSYRAYCIEVGLAMIAQAGVMTPKGASSSSRMYVGSYGPTTVARAKIINPLIAFFAQNVQQPDHILYQSIHFSGLDHSYADYTAGIFGISFLRVGTAPTDCVFEDCWVQGCDVNIRIGANPNFDFDGKVTFRRCLVTDAWAPGGSQGVLVYPGPENGAHTGAIVMDQCQLWRNGFGVDPTAQATPWPTAGTGSWVHNIRNRNIYVSGKCDPAVQSFTGCVSVLGASGDTFRSGGVIENNFFYGGYCLHSANGGYGSTSGSLKNNVLQRFQFTPGSPSGSAHPGHGFLHGGGSSDITSSGNIFSSAQDSVADTSGVAYGFKLLPIQLDNTPGFTAQFQTPTQNITISGNILDCNFNPTSVFWAEDGDTDAGRQLGVPITGNLHTNGAVLTCTPIGTGTGTPGYQWKYRDARPVASGGTAGVLTDLAGEINPTYTQTATTSGLQAKLECHVAGLVWNTTLGLVNNSITNNIIVHPTSVEKRYTVLSGTGTQTPPTPGGTGTGVDAPGVTVSGNRVYTTLAAAAAANGWSGHTRTLKTYAQSLGISVSSTDGASEVLDVVCGTGSRSGYLPMQRGNWDSRLDGVRIVNYIRAGRNMAPIS